MSELARQFDVHPTQIKQWKDQLLEGVTDVFDDKPKASKESEVDVKSLHAKIGQLTLENDFLGFEGPWLQWGRLFTSIDVIKTLKDANIQISMDGKGAWRDNVFVERLGERSKMRRSICAPMTAYRPRVKVCAGI